MRAKKWLTFITAFCTLLGIILMIIFYYSDIKIGYDITLAMLGSSLLGFIMSLIEYFSERRRTMQDFWKEAMQTLSKLRKAKYIMIVEPEELLLNCFEEEFNNKRVEQYGEEMASHLGIKVRYEAKNEYIKWLKIKEAMCFTEEDDENKILSEMYVQKIDEAKLKLVMAMKNYIELSQINLLALDSAYGSLDFMFSNRSIRQNAYDCIFDKIRKIKREIGKEVFHFNRWQEGRGSFVVCAKKALQISNMLFEGKQRNDNGLKYECIYQSLFDEIDDALEDFRIKIYWSNKKEEIERFPVLARVIEKSPSI
ncbi:MAG: hypothetical protein HFH23_11045 [Ruminococcus sp.]|nr:hypothetical protein [Ruminococcus sp.]